MFRYLQSKKKNVALYYLLFNALDIILKKIVKIEDNNTPKST